LFVAGGYPGVSSDIVELHDLQQPNTVPECHIPRKDLFTNVGM
jgi:hypothetical protein